MRRALADRQIIRIDLASLRFHNPRETRERKMICDKEHLFLRFSRQIFILLKVEIENDYRAQND